MNNDFIMSCKVVLTPEIVENLWFKYGFLHRREDATKSWSQIEKARAVRTFLEVKLKRIIQEEMATDVKSI